MEIQQQADDKQQVEASAAWTPVRRHRYDVPRPLPTARPRSLTLPSTPPVSVLSNVPQVSTMLSSVPSLSPQQTTIDHSAHHLCTLPTDLKALILEYMNGTDAIFHIVHRCQRLALLACRRAPHRRCGHDRLFDCMERNALPLIHKISLLKFEFIGILQLLLTCRNV